MEKQDKYNVNLQILFNLHKTYFNLIIKQSITNEALNQNVNKQKNDLNSQITQMIKINQEKEQHWQNVLNDQKIEKKKISITGHKGSGKSLLLKQIACKIFKQKPILTFIGKKQKIKTLNFQDFLIQITKGYIEKINAYYQNKKFKQQLQLFQKLVKDPMAGSFFKKILKNQKIIIMFDDYDDIHPVDMLKYRIYLDFISALDSLNQKSTIIFTSRHLNNISIHFKIDHYYQISSLKKSEIKERLKNIQFLSPFLKILQKKGFDQILTVPLYVKSIIQIGQMKRNKQINKEILQYEFLQAFYQNLITKHQKQYNIKNFEARGLFKNSYDQFINLIQIQIKKDSANNFIQEKQIAQGQQVKYSQRVNLITTGILDKNNNQNLNQKLKITKEQISGYFKYKGADIVEDDELFYIQRLGIIKPIDFYYLNLYSCQFKFVHRILQEYFITTFLGKQLFYQFEQNKQYVQTFLNFLRKNSNKYGNIIKLLSSQILSIKNKIQKQNLLSENQQQKKVYYNYFNYFQSEVQKIEINNNEGRNVSNNQCSKAQQQQQRSEKIQFQKKKQPNPTYSNFTQLQLFQLILKQLQKKSKLTQQQLKRVQILIKQIDRKIQLIFKKNGLIISSNLNKYIKTNSIDQIIQNIDIYKKYLQQSQNNKDKLKLILLNLKIKYLIKQPIVQIKFLSKQIQTHQNNNNQTNMLKNYSKLINFVQEIDEQITKIINQNEEQNHDEQYDSNLKDLLQKNQIYQFKNNLYKFDILIYNLINQKSVSKELFTQIITYNKYQRTRMYIDIKDILKNLELFNIKLQNKYVCMSLFNSFFQQVSKVIVKHQTIQNVELVQLLYSQNSKQFQDQISKIKNQLLLRELIKFQENEQKDNYLLLYVEGINIIEIYQDIKFKESSKNTKLAKLLKFLQKLFQKNLFPQNQFLNKQVKYTKSQKKKNNYCCKTLAEEILNGNIFLEVIIDSSFKHQKQQELINCINKIKLIQNQFNYINLIIVCSKIKNQQALNQDGKLLQKARQQILFQKKQKSIFFCNYIIQNLQVMSKVKFTRNNLQIKGLFIKIDESIQRFNSIVIQHGKSTIDECYKFKQLYQVVQLNQDIINDKIKYYEQKLQNFIRQLENIENKQNKQLQKNDKFSKTTKESTQSHNSVKNQCQDPNVFKYKNSIQDKKIKQWILKIHQYREQIKNLTFQQKKEKLSEKIMQIFMIQQMNLTQYSNIVKYLKVGQNKIKIYTKNKKPSSQYGINNKQLGCIQNKSINKFKTFSQKNALKIQDDVNKKANPVGFIENLHKKQDIQIDISFYSLENKSIISFNSIKQNTYNIQEGIKSKVYYQNKPKSGINKVNDIGYIQQNTPGSQNSCNFQNQNALVQSLGDKTINVLQQIKDLENYDLSIHNLTQELQNNNISSQNIKKIWKIAVSLYFQEYADIKYQIKNYQQHKCKQNKQSVITGIINKIEYKYIVLQEKNKQIYKKIKRNHNISNLSRKWYHNSQMRFINYLFKKFQLDIWQKMYPCIIKMIITNTNTQSYSNQKQQITIQEKNYFDSKFLYPICIKAKQIYQSYLKTLEKNQQKQFSNQDQNQNPNQNQNNSKQKEIPYKHQLVTIDHFFKKMIKILEKNQNPIDQKTK